MSNLIAPPDHLMRDAEPLETVSELVSGIFDDAQTLIAQQVHMLSVEFREDIQRTKETAPR